MSRRPTPLEQMRQLADDGMEPWQIAAAMNVRESAVLVALGSHTPAGGAVRAVERASGGQVNGPGPAVVGDAGGVDCLVPAEASEPVEKPDRPASRGSGAMALRDRLRALGVTAEQVRDWAATRGVQCPANGPVPGRVVDAWEAAHAAPLADLDDVAAAFREHAAAVDAEVDAITPEQVEQRLREVLDEEHAEEEAAPVEEEPLVWDRDENDRLVDEALAARYPESPVFLAAPDAPPLPPTPDPHIDVTVGPVIVCMTRCYDCQFGEHREPPAWHSWAAADDVEHAHATGQPDPSKSRCQCSCADVGTAAAHEMPPDVTPEHVHDPYVAWTEAGIPYAVCDCGQTWERQTCEACRAIVAALHVAVHGPIHKHCAAKRAAEKNATERTNP